MRVMVRHTLTTLGTLANSNNMVPVQVVDVSYGGA